VRLHTFVLGLRAEHVALLDAAQGPPPAGTRERSGKGWHGRIGAAHLDTPATTPLRGVYIGTPDQAAERLAAPHDRRPSGASPPCTSRFVGVQPTGWLTGADLLGVLENACDEGLSDIGELEWIIGAVERVVLALEQASCGVCMAEPGCSANGFGIERRGARPSPSATSLTT